MQDVPPPQVVGAANGDGFSSGLRMRGRDVSAPDPNEDEGEDFEGWVKQDVPSPEERRWGTWLALASFADVLTSGAITCMSFSYAYRVAGVSLWCMGIQAISHFLSSVMLMFRFAGERTAGQHEDEDEAANLMRRHRRRWLVREQGVAICMGIVMLLSSAGLLFKAFRKIKFWGVWYKDHEDMDKTAEKILEVLAWYGFAWYFIQAVFRFVSARKLRRSLIWHGFVASVVSLVFLMLMGLAASYQKEWSWKAEPICAIALSFVTLAEGVRIVIMHLDDMDVRLRFDPRA